MSLPLVTVVIPTRNRHDVLVDSLASVARQTYRPLECVVVDDASNPPVNLAHCSVRGMLDMRVVLCEQRVGRGRARNEGLAVARGDMVFFWDDDDLLKPQALASLVSALERHPNAVASTCGIECFGHWSGRPPWPRRELCVDVFWDCLYGVALGGAGVLYRASVLRRVGGLVEGLEVAEDWLGGLRIAAQGSYVVLPDRSKLVRTRPSHLRDEGEFRRAECILPDEAAMWASARDSRRLVSALRASRHWRLGVVALSEHRRLSGFGRLGKAIVADPRIVQAKLLWRLHLGGFAKALLPTHARSVLRWARRSAVAMLERLGVFKHPPETVPHAGELAQDDSIPGATVRLGADVERGR